MNDQDFQAAIVAALQPVVQAAGRPVNYDFAPIQPAEVTGTVSPQ